MEAANEYNAAWDSPYGVDPLDSECGYPAECGLGQNYIALQSWNVRHCRCYINICL
ncbi:hypothetical protein D3C87_2061320 [compost metagenome]